MAVTGTVKSSERFRFRIISFNGAYSTFEPAGVPTSLRLDFNRADQLVAELRPEDRLKVSVNLDQVRRGDFVELMINSVVSFFGTIFNKKTIRTGTTNKLMIEAHDQLRELDQFQINQHIFQEYDDLKHTQVGSESFPEPAIFSNLDEGIKPLPAVEVFQPFGVYGVGSFSKVDNVENTISFSASNVENRMIVVFKPSSTTIEKLWVHLVDKGGSNQIFTPIQVSVSEVDRIAADIPLDIIQLPSSSLLTRGGNPAEKLLTTAVKETWRSATDDGTVLTSSDMSWISAVGGSDTTTIIAAAANFEFGSEAFCRLAHSTGGTASITTTLPGTDPNFAPSGWVAIQIRMSTIAVSGFVDIFVTGDIIAARVEITTSNNLILHYGDNQTNQFVTGYVVNDRHYLYFRFRPERMEFDFEFSTNTTGLASTGPTNVGINFRLLNFTSFTTPPSRITKYQISVTDTATTFNLDVGWVSGTEIGLEPIREGFAQVDFSDDPIDVEPGVWICLVVRAGTSPLTGTQHINWDPRRNIGKLLTPEVRFLRSDNADSGAPIWRESLIGGVGSEFPFMIEYADSYKRVFEDQDFLVDYDNKKIFWTKGGFRGIRVVRIDIGGRGMKLFDIARVSEYRNPATNGIIQPAREMRLPDVVKFVANFTGLFSNVIVDGDNDGTDDADGFGFNTSEFAIPVYIAEQASTLEIQRDLCDEFNGIMFVTPEASPTFFFELTKQIVDININTPGVHEFVLSMERSIGDDDAHRVRRHDVGPAENNVYTSFETFGKEPRFRALTKNHTLIDDFGNDFRRPAETFSREIDQEKLTRFNKALDSAFGVRLIEGEILVSDYWPPAPGVNAGRLDINGIIRLIDSQLQNGMDLTGIENVFKIQSIDYNGKTNKTKLVVSNRNLHRFTEERLEQKRNLLNGVQPSDPTDIFKDRTIDRAVLRISSSSLVDVYMALYVDGVEIDTKGYDRIKCFVTVQNDGYISFSSFFEAGIGFIQSARHPVDEVRLFDAVISGTQLAAADMSLQRDKIYKFESSKLSMFIFVADEDVFGPL